MAYVAIGLVAFAAVMLGIAAAPYYFFHARPIDLIAERAKSMIGGDGDINIATLDQQFKSMHLKAGRRLDWPADQALAGLQEEVHDMGWSPKPPRPENERVVCYVSLWYAVFVYVGKDGRISRVAKCST